MTQVMCYRCGSPGHTADDCADTRTWVDCAECRRPGHPPQRDIGRDGTWFCLDCRDPAWRARLPAGDARHRKEGQPLSRHSRFCYEPGGHMAEDVPHVPGLLTEDLPQALR